MTSDPWHYPRGELAQHILRVLGVVDRVAMFAPRRKGKTWFLLRDLAPVGTQNQFVPVYASLWRTPDRPHVAIVDALKLASKTLDRKRIPWTEYLGQLSSVSATISGVGGGGIKWSRRQEADSNELASMGELLSTVVEKARKKNRQVLFLLDEAQHLATSEAFESTAKSLRTAMEGIEATFSQQLCSVFTGSSRTDLSLLLEHKNAAFYRSFDHQELPDLDQGYTNFVAAQLKRLGRVKVDSNELWETFGQLHKSPYFMKLLIRELMLKRVLSLSEGRNVVLKQIVENPEYKLRWDSLTEIEKVLFERIDDQISPYSQEVLKQIATVLNEPGLKTSQIQNAVRQLQKKGLIGKVGGPGEYRILDPELIAWRELTVK